MTDADVLAVMKFAASNSGRRVVGIAQSYPNKPHRGSMLDYIRNCETRVVGYGNYANANSKYVKCGVAVFVNDQKSPILWDASELATFVSYECGGFRNRVVLSYNLVCGKRGWMPFFQPEHLVLEGASDSEVLSKRVENPWPHDCPDCGGPALFMAFMVDCKNRCSPQRTWR